MSDNYCFNCGGKLLKINTPTGTFNRETGEPGYVVKVTCSNKKFPWDLFHTGYTESGNTSVSHD